MPPILPELKAVIDAYALVAKPGFRARGRAADWRKIQPTNWPVGLHYEFCAREEQVSVELHVERDKFIVIRDHLVAIVAPLQDSYESIAVRDWQKTR